jgi:hypothetical protein
MIKDTPVTVVKNVLPIIYIVRLLVSEMGNSNSELEWNFVVCGWGWGSSFYRLRFNSYGFHICTEGNEKNWEGMETFIFIVFMMRLTDLSINNPSAVFRVILGEILLYWIGVGVRAEISGFRVDIWVELELGLPISEWYISLVQLPWSFSFFSICYILFSCYRAWIIPFLSFTCMGIVLSRCSSSRRFSPFVMTIYSCHLISIQKRTRVKIRPHIDLKKNVRFSLKQR